LVLEGDFFRLAESKEFTFDTKLRTFVRKSNLADASPLDNASAKPPPPPGTKLNPFTGDGNAFKT
jgi:hypothetical protein